MTLDTLLHDVFRSAVWRSMHHAPLWLALAIAAGIALLALRRR